MPFIDASAAIFGGLQTLLDDQVAAERRPAAVVRLRKYAGVEPGYTPFTDVLKQRVMEQMAKPGVVYPRAVEMETELGRNKNYVDGIADAVREVQADRLAGAVTRSCATQLAATTRGCAATVLPKARTDFRLPPEEYALSLESYGVDIPPAQLAAMAHKAFHRATRRR